MTRMYTDLLLFLTLSVFIRDLIRSVFIRY
jgi:hypothetical protein